MPRGVPLDGKQLAAIKVDLALGIAQRAIARCLGITQQAVSAVGIRCQAEIAGLKAHTNPRLARLYEEKLMVILESITPEKMREATLRELAVTGAFLVDKALLLGGGATTMQEDVHVTADEINEEIARSRAEFLRRVTEPPEMADD
jgi:hypothetical protein